MFAYVRYYDVWYIMYNHFDITAFLDMTPVESDRINPILLCLFFYIVYLLSEF